MYLSLNQFINSLEISESINNIIQENSQLNLKVKEIL